MKKIISMALSLVLLVSMMSVSVSASTYLVDDGSSTSSEEDNSFYEDEYSEENSPAIDIDSLELPPIRHSTQANKAPELPLFTGVKLIPHETNNGIVIDGCSDGYYYIKDTKTGKYGVVDSDEAMTDIIPPIYDDVFYDHNTNGFVAQNNGNFIYLDKAGRVIKTALTGEYSNDNDSDEDTYNEILSKRGFNYIEETEISNVFTGSVGDYPNRRKYFINANEEILYPEPITNLSTRFESDQYIIVQLFKNGRYQVLDKTLALVYECSPNAEYPTIDKYGNCIEEINGGKGRKYISLPDGKSFSFNNNCFVKFEETGATFVGQISSSNTMEYAYLINKNGDILIPVNKGYTSFSVTITRTGVPIVVASKGNTSDIYQLTK